MFQERRGKGKEESREHAVAQWQVRAPAAFHREGSDRVFYLSWDRLVWATRP